MNYKLKLGKQLTKKDLINTKWKITTPEMPIFKEVLRKFGFEHFLTKGINTIVMDGTYENTFGGDGWDGKHTRCKFMNFHDWFEEDNNK